MLTCRMYIDALLTQTLRKKQLDITLLYAAPLKTMECKQFRADRVWSIWRRVVVGNVATLQMPNPLRVLMFQRPASNNDWFPTCI